MNRNILFSICTFSVVLRIANAADALLAKTETAVRRAVSYLESKQQADGSFGTFTGSKMPGAVALVVHALAENAQPLKLLDSDTINKGRRYILSQQKASGAIYSTEFGLENVNTSMAVYALSALNRPEDSSALLRAKTFVLACQMDEQHGLKPETNTLSYGAFAEDTHQHANLMATGITLDALQAMGLEKTSPAWKNAERFIRRCQDNTEINDSPEMKNGDNTGAFVYLPGFSEFGSTQNRRGQQVPRPYGSMTYVAMKSLIYCGVSSDDPALKSALQWIRKNYSVKTQNGAEGTQGYYYYVVALAKAFTALRISEVELSDDKKVQWSNDLASHLISLQQEDGSFVNTEPRYMENEPVICTAYVLEALNLCLNDLRARQK